MLRNANTEGTYQPRRSLLVKLRCIIGVPYTKKMLLLARRILLIVMTVLLPLQGSAAAMPSCEKDAPASHHHDVQDSSQDSFTHGDSNAGQTGETDHAASHLCCSVALPAPMSGLSTDAVHAYSAAPAFDYPSFVPNLPKRPPLA